MGNDAKQQPKEIMRVLYNIETPQVVYGHIAFYRPLPEKEEGQPPEKEEVRLYKESSPFVIAETFGSGEIVVLGSAEALVRDVQRLLERVRGQINELNAELMPTTTEEAVQGERTILLTVPKGDREQQLYAEAKKRIADTLILISTQARNLFDMFPRLDHKISVLDYDGRSAGKHKAHNSVQPIRA